MVRGTLPTTIPGSPKLLFYWCEGYVLPDPGIATASIAAQLRRKNLKEQAPNFYLSRATPIFAELTFPIIPAQNIRYTVGAIRNNQPVARQKPLQRVEVRGLASSSVEHDGGCIVASLSRISLKFSEINRELSWAEERLLLRNQWLAAIQKPGEADAKGQSLEALMTALSAKNYAEFWIRCRRFRTIADQELDFSLLTPDVVSAVVADQPRQPFDLRRIRQLTVVQYRAGLEKPKLSLSSAHAQWPGIQNAAQRSHPEFVTSIDYDAPLDESFAYEEIDFAISTALKQMALVTALKIAVDRLREDIASNPGSAISNWIQTFGLLYRSWLPSQRSGIHYPIYRALRDHFLLQEQWATALAAAQSFILGIR
jgi:hypothetical protein